MSINSTDLGMMSKQYAARDLPGQTKLKYRDLGQAAPEEVKRDKKDLKKDLESRERSSNKDSKRLAISDKETPAALSSSSKKIKWVEKKKRIISKYLLELF